MKKILLLIFLIIISTGGYYYYNKYNAEVSTTTYEFIKIEKGNIKKIVSATGKIIPTSSQILSSEISGKIVDVEKARARTGTVQRACLRRGFAYDRGSVG